MKPLTIEQQKLVEQNHNLIYDFIKRKNLFIDDYYDILAIGLCKAAQIYNSEKGEFSTIANTCMTNEVNMYLRYINANGRIPDEKILSYDTPLSNDGEQTPFIDTMNDGSNMSDEAISNIVSSSLLDMLNDSEKLVVKLTMKGLTQRQIAEKMNTKQQNISYIVKKIKSKWSLFNDN